MTAKTPSPPKRERKVNTTATLCITCSAFGVLAILAPWRFTWFHTNEKAAFYESGLNSLIQNSLLENLIETLGELIREVAVWIESANRLARVALFVDNDD